jgi:hypothetical protein
LLAISVLLARRGSEVERTSHHLCRLRDVSPTTPGASGAVVPWNYYSRVPLFPRSLQEEAMNGLIYLIGLIVVILAILSFFGLR